MDLSQVLQFCFNQCMESWCSPLQTMILTTEALQKAKHCLLVGNPFQRCEIQNLMGDADIGGDEPASCEIIYCLGGPCLTKSCQVMPHVMTTYMSSK